MEYMSARDLGREVGVGWVSSGGNDFQANCANVGPLQWRIRNTLPGPLPRSRMSGLSHPPTMEGVVVHLVGGFLLRGL